VDSPILQELYHQATDIVAQNAGTTDATAHSAALYEHLLHFSDSLNHVTSFGLFPLCVALLILHEQARAMTDGGHFRLAFVFGRIIVFAVLVYAAYGNLCRLITSVFGGGSGWMRTDHLLKMFDLSGVGLSRAWDNMTEGLGMLDSVLALGKFLALLGVWMIVLGCALSAYVAGLLLSSAQAILMTICLAVGTTCLTLSLVPGVRLAGSWARALALTAAWSRIAAVIAAMFPVNAGKPLYLSLINGNFGDLLFIAGRYVLLAFATLAVPAIAAKIGSGAGGVAAGVGEILRSASKRAGGAWRSLAGQGKHNTSGDMESRRDGDRRFGRGSFGHGGEESFGTSSTGSAESPLRATSRPALGALREGLATASRLALAPFALMFSRGKPRAPESDSSAPGIGPARQTASARDRKVAGSEGAPIPGAERNGRDAKTPSDLRSTVHDAEDHMPGEPSIAHVAGNAARGHASGDPDQPSRQLAPASPARTSVTAQPLPAAVPGRDAVISTGPPAAAGRVTADAKSSAAEGRVGTPSSSPASAPALEAATARPRASQPAQSVAPGPTAPRPAAAGPNVAASPRSASEPASPASPPSARATAPAAPARSTHPPTVLRRETLVRDEQPPATIRREKE